MGDRAVISNNAKNLGVYLHWNGYREFVESVLAYCDLKQYRSPDSDDEYGWARLCQIIGNTLGGTLSLGVGRYEWIRTTKITELILFKVGILKTDYINIMQTTKENILSLKH